MAAAQLNEESIRKLVASDDWMMKVLKTAENEGLPDWWIGAGFLRNRVWDAMEGNPARRSRDVDLVFFDSDDATYEHDAAITEQMNKDYPLANWEVRNQARMHVKDHSQPFDSTAEGIAHWTETATAVAVKLCQGKLRFLYCYGSADLLGLVVRPVTVNGKTTPTDLILRRVKEKRWESRWPDLKIEV